MAGGRGRVDDPPGPPAPTPPVTGDPTLYPRTVVSPSRVRPQTIVIERTPGKFDALPPWSTDPPKTTLIPPESALPFVSNQQSREMTFAAAEGVRPVLLGGPLRIGSRLIGGPMALSDFLYLDYFLTVGGPGGIGSITDIRVGGVPIATVAYAWNVHMGGVGDTTDALMAEAQGGYLVADYSARVSAKFARLNEAAGQVDLSQLTAICTGPSCYDPRTGTYVQTRNPFLHMRESLTNDRWGKGLPSAEVDDAGIIAAANIADEYINAPTNTIRRWEESLFIDSEQQFQAWMDVMRLHCMGAVVYGDVYKLIADVARAAVSISLTDTGADPNMDEPIVETKGSEERPSHVIGQYTDQSQDYKDAEVVVPVGGPPAGVDPLPMTLVIKGCMTAERATRLTTHAFNRAQKRKRIHTTVGQIGMALEPGDRVTLNSRKFGPGGTLDSILTQSEMKEIGYDVFFEEYDAAVYADAAIAQSGPPPVAPPPDPRSVPAPVSGLTVPNSNSDELGLVEFFPSPSGFVMAYEILDAFGDPANPPLLKTVLEGSPLNAAGKYSVKLTQAIHVSNVDLSRHLKVAVRAISVQNVASTLVYASWDLTALLPTRTKDVYGKASALKNLQTVGWSTAQSTPNPGGAPFFVVTADNVTVRFGRNSASGTPYEIWRTFLEFVTNDSTIGMPSDATVLRGRLRIYHSGSSATGGATAPRVYVEKSSAADMPLTSADWALRDGVSYGYLDVYLSPTGGYAEIVIPAALINRVGKTKLVLVTEWDHTNTAPPDLTSGQTLADGTPNASPGPLLAVDYTSLTADVQSGGGGGGPFVVLQPTPVTKQAGGLFVDKLVSDAAVVGGFDFGRLALPFGPQRIDLNRLGKTLIFTVPLGPGGSQLKCQIAYCAFGNYLKVGGGADDFSSASLAIGKATLAGAGDISFYDPTLANDWMDSQQFLTAYSARGAFVFAGGPNNGTAEYSSGDQIVAEVTTVLGFDGTVDVMPFAVLYPP
jgi:hypothetical protein